MSRKDDPAFRALPPNERAKEFEAKLLALVNDYGVMLTAEDGMVGYSCNFAAVNLSFYQDEGPSPYWPQEPESST